MMQDLEWTNCGFRFNCSMIDAAYNATQIHDAMEHRFELYGYSNVYVGQGSCQIIKTNDVLNIFHCLVHFRKHLICKSESS